MNSMMKSPSIMNRLFILAAMILSLALLQAPAMAADADGKVIFLIGQAWVEKPNGGQLPLTQGMGVSQGDTIVTAENGQVHIRTSDGGYIAIMPNSRFNIESYKYSPGDGADKSSDASYYRLLKGGFRSITGAIGQNNKQAYRVKTPVATIGIRGTDYTARLCDADCVDVNGNTMQDGLYLGVWQGGVTLANSGGSLDVDVNQFGFVANNTSVPVQRAPVAGNVLHASTGSATQTTVASGAASTQTVTTVASADTGTQVGSEGSNNSTTTTANNVIALPATGTATYTNTQNNSVTTSGNINGAENATVKSATMTVDFGTMKADMTVEVDMTNEVLTTTATNMSIDQNTATFGTDASSTTSVTATDKVTSTTVPVAEVHTVTVKGEFTGQATETGPTGANAEVELQGTDGTTGEEQQMNINTEMSKQ
jgi:hypothetical protein